MNFRSVFIIIPLTVALLCATISAETIDLEVEFSQTDLSFAVRDGYDQVYMRGLDLTREPGQPQLPLMAARALIPPGARIDGVEVVEMELMDLPGNYDIYPAQPPQILSLSPEDLAKISFVEPQEKLYRSREPFPSQAVRLTGSGYLAGYHLADLEICPLVYIPAERKLQFCRSIRFVVNTSPGGRPARPVGRRGEGSRQFYEAVVKDLSLNPAETATMAPRIEAVSSKALSPGDYEYVIITQSTYADEFQPLADWKGQKGVSDTVVTREWIEGSYSGYDVREQIRNFIIDAYQNWGTRWVLLGGDTNVIPSRTAYAMTCEAGYHSKEDSIRADLYFADLDGDWDADGDHVFGELADSVDLYPDVFVGRASVSSQSEAQAWVDKVLLYEKSPQPDHPLKMLFLAEILWSFPNYTDGGVHKDMIDDQSVPPRFDPIKKLYESLGNESADSARYYFNQGQNLVNHDGHCWYDVMSMGDGSFNRSSMDNLTNGARPSILYSIGCWPAAFDFDCMAEHWTNNPDGGGVAFVGNNRYGWGSPGNPGYGYSDIYDSRFFHELFVSGQVHIGATLAAAKTCYVPKSRQENVYRIHQYQLNLLGDPEMPIWTDTPETLHVIHSDQVPQGPVSFEVTVTDGSNPVGDALVCAASAGGLYQRDYTGANGQIVLALTVPTSDPVKVTVTARDFLPHVDSAAVISDGAHIVRLEYALDDSAGNGNGELNPGDTVDLSISLKNCGQDTASAVSAVLRSSHELATVLDSMGTYGDLGPDDTTSSDYRVFFSADCGDGQVFYLDLEIQDDQAHTWNSTMGLSTVEPRMVYLDCAVDDGGDGIPEPGEEVDLDLFLQNAGMGTAQAVSARLSTLDDYVAVLQDSAGYGLIEPESSAVSEPSYHLAIADSCPSRHLAPMRLDVVSGEEYAWADGLMLAIGAWGFGDNMESGEGGWTHGGNKDNWHLSSYRSHSDSTSWYCGLDSTRQYEDGMNAYLLSPEIVLGPDSKLSFWTWYDVTIYGTDGLYVVVGKDAQWDTLDYIGSGGALDSLCMGNDWLPDEYDLSAYDTVQVKFIFKTNLNDHDAEGMYIDDVTISGALMALEDVLPPNPATDLRVTLVDTALVLSWSPGDGEETDHYVVYRDTLWNFQPAGANSLAMTADTTYLDEDIGVTGDAGRNYYYLIRAVDAVGNKSSPSDRVGEFDAYLDTGK